MNKAADELPGQNHAGVFRFIMGSRGGFLEAAQPKQMHQCFKNSAFNHLRRKNAFYFTLVKNGGDGGSNLLSGANMNRAAHRRKGAVGKRFCRRGDERDI